VHSSVSVIEGLQICEHNKVKWNSSLLLYKYDEVENKCQSRLYEEEEKERESERMK
jgi:hypothetical protein